MQGLNFTCMFLCVEAFPYHFIMQFPLTFLPHPLPPLPLAFSLTFCSFSHSSSFPVTVVWIPCLVVRGLQADTTPSYMSMRTIVNSTNSTTVTCSICICDKHLQPTRTHQVVNSRRQPNMLRVYRRRKKEIVASPTILS